MSNPIPISIPEKAWLKIDSGLLIGTLYLVDGSFKYYKTYRGVDETAPDDNILPDNKANFTGIRMFQGIDYDELTFFGKKDVYIYCVNADDDSSDSGRLLYFPEEDRSSKKVDNFPQDQTTQFDDLFFTQAIGVPTTLTADTIFDSEAETFSRIMIVASIANISIGDFVFVFSGISGEERFYSGTVLAISTLTLTMDNPFDFIFSSGDTVVSSTKDMNIDASGTPQIYEIRAGGAGSTREFDITRILMKNLSDTAVDLSKFGDIVGGVTNGLLLRDKLSESVYKNKWNIKTNGDMALLAYDWAPFAATNPVQGQDGFRWRYSINGMDKHGVVKRIGTNKSLQILLQDNFLTLDQLQTIGAISEVD